jgi:hypothetical protein
LLVVDLAGHCERGGVLQLRLGWLAGGEQNVTETVERLGLLGLRAVLATEGQGLLEPVEGFLVAAQSEVNER